MVIFEHAPAVATRPRGGALHRTVAAKTVVRWIGAVALAAALLSACGGSGQDPDVLPITADGVWNATQWDQARWQ